MRLPNIAETPQVYDQFSGFDAINIRIDASLKNSLLWQGLEEEIDLVLKRGAKLVIEFDFDLMVSGSSFHDEMSYRAHKLAIVEFLKRVYAVYPERVAAVILYRGTGDLTRQIALDSSLLIAFQQWCDDQQLDREAPHSMRLFSIDLLMEYLHRLGAGLPEEIPQIALFQFSKTLKPSEVATLISKERFPYIYPGIKKSSIRYDGPQWEGGEGQNGYIGYQAPPAPAAEEGAIELGLILPRLEKLNYAVFDKALEDLEGEAYRIIPEALISEMWHELDEIVAFESATTREGERMLQGFIAAGGVIRGRGI